MSSPGTSLVARCRFITSTSYSLDVLLQRRDELGPSVCCTEMKFSMPRVSITWPPKRSASTPVRMPLRAA